VFTELLRQAECHLDGGLQPTSYESYEVFQARESVVIQFSVTCIFGWGKQHGTMRKTKQA
jgi:hypothetical protein